MKTLIEIVRNVPEPFPSTYVDWNLGTLCNYACSYCPERLHDGALKWPDVDVAIRFCERAIDHYRTLGRKTFIKFTGGEPTLYKHLIALLRRIKALGGYTGLNSNGSRNLAWWDRAIEHLDFIVLTHHVEYADTDHFVSLINRLREHDVTVHINVTMLPERFDECVLNASILRSRCKGISICLKPLFIDFKHQMYPYSDEQKEMMRAPGFALRDEDTPGGMRCMYADGTSHVVESQDFILRDENHWRSWNCNAGIESLAVRADGQIYRAVCQQMGPLGNLRDGSISFPAEPILCGKDTCKCLADIKISKWRDGAHSTASPASKASALSIARA